MLDFLLELILKFILSFFITFCFGVIFNAPKKELLYCGLIGGMAWFVRQIAFEITSSDTTAVFFGAMSAALFARIFSFSRNTPATLYLIPGILLLVPGSTLYYTMTEILANHMENSYRTGVATIKMAGAIAVGVVVVFNIPYRFFCNKTKPNN